MALVEIALVSWGLGVDEFLAMAEEMQVLFISSCATTLHVIMFLVAQQLNVSSCFFFVG